jgi:hypothetical protein
MISLHSYLAYTYEQQIFIDEIKVYSRRHTQLSSTRGHSGGQPNIFCFVLFHWSERFSELFLACSSLRTANPFRIERPIKQELREKKVESKTFQPVCYKGTKKMTNLVTW